MDIIEKLEYLKTQEDPEVFYEVLGTSDLLVSNYGDFIKSRPADADEELKRLPNAGFKLACAFMTMLLREDYFSGGMFTVRRGKGQVAAVLDRMIAAYKEKNSKEE
ncbi:MAG: DUF6508 domain-containing protein [Bacillota bacterium]|nr:DUF6508 domain-containing protein [Bacillota bacterium]